MDRRHFTLSTGAALAAALLAGCSDKPADAPAPAAPAAPAKPPQDAYETAAKGTGFSIGPMMAANTVYVFFDPTCPHCAKLWTNAQPLLGKFKMVWIPIALRPATTRQGATILAAPDPAAAMATNESLVMQGKSGIPESPSLPDDAVAKVKANTDLFASLGADSVPFIVFKNAKTAAHGTHAGELETAQLADLVGI